MKRLLRTSFALFLLVIALLASAAWVASYFWWPTVSFPWPTSGLSQTHDGGFLVLVSGRVFVVRQRVEVANMVNVTALTGAPTIVLGGPSDQTQTPPMLSSDTPEATAALEEGTAYFTVNSRRLGTLSIASGVAGSPARSTGTIVTGPVEPQLARTTWRWLGFASEPLGMPRMRVASVDLTANWTRTALPLWPLVLLGAPGAMMLYRNRRSRRWAAAGRCVGCGYDLRETPQRCPECGLVPAGRCVGCGYDLRGSPERCPECGLAPPGTGEAPAVPAG